MIKKHNHDMKTLKDFIFIPFENTTFVYTQHHCQDDKCDYHEYRYVSHDEVEVKT